MENPGLYAAQPVVIVLLMGCAVVTHYQAINWSVVSPNASLLNYERI